MPTLPAGEIERLLLPFLPSPSSAVLVKLGLYLDLLVKWNERTNLTAIRDPREMVTRHLGESLFAAAHVGAPSTLLDFGSGAGFPGLPIALLRPEIHVTLAESQNKKATFLREAVRVLGLTTEVWGARVEDLPPSRRFDCVALRAVDQMERAVLEAGTRAIHTVALLTTSSALDQTWESRGFSSAYILPVPESAERVFAAYSRPAVPRGTPE